MRLEGLSPLVMRMRLSRNSTIIRSAAFSEPTSRIRSRPTLKGRSGICRVRAHSIAGLSPKVFSEYVRLDLIHSA